MKNRKTLRRNLVLFAALTLAAAALFVVGGYVKNNTGKDVSARASNPVAPGGSGSKLAEIRAERRERGETFIRYSDASGSENLRIAMDEVVVKPEKGRQETVALNPIATPATFKERLAAVSATDRVFPVAYADGQDRLPETAILITSEISAKMPREQAKSLAAEHGLKIVEFPEYAPEWVIFAATDPIAALEKIGGIREETAVAKADVVLARRYKSMVLPNDTRIGDQWHIKESNGAAADTDINVEDIWQYDGVGGIRGKGINIGVIDSGIQTNHPDFVGNINTAIDYDYVDNDNDPNPDDADENHGTAVAGVSAARGNNALGVSGVAPEATIVAERLITGDNISDTAIASALAHRADVIHIKNNSWGYTAPFYKITDLIAESLRTSSTTGRGGKGMIFTFSAGNDGDVDDSANYDELANSIYTIAVGANSSKGGREFYSEPGANLVITAPSGGVPGHPQHDGGLGIVTTDRTGSAGYNRAAGAAGDYANDFNGTSASCPVVSGVIALMLEKNPNLGWRDVQDVLIRSAFKNTPNEPGWKTNAAGLHFNNDYGAGLVDATAAVNRAAAHTNLAAQRSVVSNRSDIGVPIPNNASVGASVEFQLPTSNLITEHVTLRLNIDHSARGELDIFLTSPSGTISQLAVKRNDFADNYDNFTFTTVHNWGENSSGVWTLKVVDTSNTTNTIGGRIRSAVMTVYGVVAPPVNPAPIVQISSPLTDAIFSPNVGFNVNVDVSDFDIDGNPDEVTKVDLYENDVLVETIPFTPSTPFTFSRNPANGTYVYVARATDPDGKEGSSAPVTVTVKNQTPVINTVVVSASGQAFDDEDIVISPVDVSDPEGDPVTLVYRWQFSTNELDYIDTINATSTLPANPSNSGKLWRCSITASDGNTISAPFVTQPVNLLDRPQAAAFSTGSPFTYQSGLVLRGDQLVIGRQAIIHEFSQGPGGGTSEWVEILTMQAGSLAGWSLVDESGSRVAFLDAPVWENIPAGTLIVIYNGRTTKDPLIPADSTDASSGKMIISSSNPAYFDQDFLWPSLANLGDSIFLNDVTGESIHEVSYGNSLLARPNVGQVISGAAAFFSGDTDEGADRAGEWLTTTANVGRMSTSGFGSHLVNPGIVLTGGRYSQNFNAEPGDNGTFFPSGWSAYTVELALTRTTNRDQMLTFQGGTVVGGGVYNFGSKVGIFGGDKAFDPGFIAMGIDNTQGVSGLRISYDLVKMVEQSRSMEVKLQYTVGNPGNTGTFWSDVPGAAHSTGSIKTGTVTKFTNIALPVIFTDRISPIYLRWQYNTAGNFGAGGGRDAIAIDNVIISSDQSPNILLNLSLSPSTIAENAGANASTGTITLSKELATATTVNILSSDTTEATVPDTVVIPAGELSATFPITAVDDRFTDGSQPVSIRLTAVNFAETEAILTVTDNEQSVVGVTPGFGNNAANAFFIDRIRTNGINEPASFRLASGSVLPDGLTLDASTGLISGTISPTATPGSYSVTIELANILFETRSQTIVINVSPSGVFTYSSWIDLFSVADKGSSGDSDFDQLPNLVEYAMNSLPGQFQQPSPVIMEKTSTEISLTYYREKNRNDVSLTAEWSASLEQNDWHTVGITELMLEDHANNQLLKASLPITPGHPARFMRLRATVVTPP